MDRRKFIVNSTWAGSCLSLSSCLPENKKDNNEIVEKVILAMLSMQRASWEHGVAAQALLELGRTDLVYLMAKEAVLRQLNDGRLSVVYTDNGVTDPACSGEPVLHTYNETGEMEFKEASDKMLDWLLAKAPRSENGTVYHTLNAPTIWVDSFYMCPPFLSFAGKHKEALRQIEGLRAALWNAEKKLYAHQWHDGEKRFMSDRFWGTGQGWAAAAFIRLLKTLPEDMVSEREKIAGYFTELLEGCLPFLRADGLFHNYVNEPDTFVETNCSQMLAYSIFSGVKLKILDKNYLEFALKMRDAAYKKADKNGYVMGVAGAPHFDRYGRSTEGQAFFLLMEAAFRKLQN